MKAGVIKIGRNDICPCGSGKKYKKCCLNRYNHFSSEQDYLNIGNYNLFECLIQSGYQEAGIANICVVRQQPNLKFTYGVYLLDIFCMGLKNTTYKFNVPYTEVELFKNRVPFDLEKISFEKARTIILGGIDYAKKLGFSPQSDWSKSKYIIESERSYIDDFEFGLNGKPYYVQGPNDNPSEIMKTLGDLNSNDYNYSIITEEFGKSNILNDNREEQTNLERL